MKIGIQIFVTARKAITMESSDFETPEECMSEITHWSGRLKLDQVKADLIEQFGED